MMLQVVSMVSLKNINTHGVETDFLYTEQKLLVGEYVVLLDHWTYPCSVLQLETAVWKVLTPLGNIGFVTYAMFRSNNRKLNKRRAKNEFNRVFKPIKKE